MSAEGAARSPSANDSDPLAETRVKLGSALRQYHALLHTLDLHSNLSVTDRNGRIIDVNDNFCRISGFSREELIGQPHNIVSSSSQSAQFWGDMWRTIGDGKTWRGEICNRAKNGTLHWVDTTILPFPGTDGLVERYISIRTDITAAKLTEQRLRSSEAFLDQTGRIAGIGGWQFDIDADHVEWSSQMNRIYQTGEDFQPSLADVLSFYTPESRPAIDRAVGEALATGAGWDLELTILTARGNPISVRSVCTVERAHGRSTRLVAATQDISTRKQAEKSLIHERELMSSVLETLPEQIYFKDSEGRFLRVNAGMAHAHGLKNTAEAVGKSDADYFPEQRALYNAECERQIMASGEAVLELEEETVWPDRPPTWSLSTKMPLYDLEDRIVGTFGISRDITARKQADDKLRETSARFGIAVDVAGIGVWEFDIGRAHLDWDERMYKIYGVEPGAPGREPYATWADCLHPQDRNRCESEIAMAVSGEKEFDSEFRIIRPDGEIRYVKAVARTVHNADGAVVRLTGVNFDVTDRRRAEINMHETSSLMRTILDSAVDTSIIATDSDLNIKVFNSGAERLTGYSSGEVVDFGTMMSLLDPSELRSRTAELDEAPQRPFPGAVLIEPSTLAHAREWTLARKDGTRIIVSLVINPMYAFTGELLGYIGVAHDMTIQKEYEASLRDATQKAEQANLAKSQFLANMSHEIRTPMNAIIGLSYLLGETRLEKAQRELLSKIEVGSQSLLAIINDVLDLTKIESRELILESTPFSPYGLLRGISDVMTMAVRAKGITFDIEICDELPVALIGDATRLRQILTNLLANAIKFTDHGGVKLIVKRLNDTAKGTTLCFSVRDTGIGISVESRARLFAPFAQADTSITRRYGGTGLGLSIVKSLATLLGGEVQLKSTPGLGSEFTVILQFASAAPEALAARQPAAQSTYDRVLSGVCVLVVDDSDINLDVTKRILELHGAQVRLAGTGQDAIDRVNESSGALDLILMDVQMPILDGYEATQRIRELGFAHLPIIALTANALSSERERAAVAGMDDFITKPFDTGTLVERILRHSRPSPAKSELPARPKIRPSEPVDSSWPDIEGIDSADARMGLCEDLDLFRSCLKRLFAEFPEVSSQWPAGNTDAAAAHAARMHKLVGIAGMLGANKIRRLAVDSRASCLAGETSEVVRLAALLTAELQQLRRSTTALLQSERLRVATESTGADVAFDSNSLAALIQLLAQHSLMAIARFEAVSHHLRGLLGEEGFADLRGHMDNLRFAEAIGSRKDCASGARKNQRSGGTEIAPVAAALGRCRNLTCDSTLAMTLGRRRNRTCVEAACDPPLGTSRSM